MVRVRDITDVYRKNPWRMSATRKARVRQRLRDVDTVIDTIRTSGVSVSYTHL